MPVVNFGPCLRPTLF